MFSFNRKHDSHHSILLPSELSLYTDDAEFSIYNYKFTKEKLHIAQKLGTLID